MSYLVDTNVISEIGKGLRCNPNVSAWYAAIDAREIYLSVLVIAEIRKGMERARPTDPARAGALERWLSEVRHAFAGRIVPIDEDIAEEWGRMAAQRSVKVVDTMLAATAKAKRLTLVTRNVADVTGFGAIVLDPFQPVRGPDHRTG